MTYELKTEPVEIDGTTIQKVNVYYAGGKYDQLKETFSINGDQITPIRDGYEKKINPDVLDEFKSDLCLLVDKQTTEQISQGVTYKNKIFSLSQNAQINWTNIPNLSEVDFPFPAVTIDDKDYLLITYTERMDFYNTVMRYVKGCRVAGGQKKMQIGGCTTIEQLKTLADQWNFSY